MPPAIENHKPSCTVRGQLEQDQPIDLFSIRFRLRIRRRNPPQIATPRIDRVKTF
jgi:hypothetical protein